MRPNSRPRADTSRCTLDGKYRYRVRLRRSRCASEPSSDSASTATFMTSRGCESETRAEFGFADDICEGAPLSGGSFANDTQAVRKFRTSPRQGQPRVLL